MIIEFGWNFKIFYAVLIDCYYPFGMRRKPWMIFAWLFVLFFLLILTLFADEMSASEWLIFSVLIQAFMMFSDVPADAYSVELGKLESPIDRGRILVTGQSILYMFCGIAGIIQTFCLNGPTTNHSDCQISLSGCWSWGLTVNQYYGLLFILTLVLIIPTLWLKELPSDGPPPSLHHFLIEIWDTIQNRSFLYIVIFVVGIVAFSNISCIVNYYLQYYVIDLTNFQAGIDTTSTYTALAIGLRIFRSFLINLDWYFSDSFNYFSIPFSDRIHSYLLSSISCLHSIYIHLK